jgi:Ca2+-binding RTX toxin-like protein
MLTLEFFQKFTLTNLADISDFFTDTPGVYPTTPIHTPDEWALASASGASRLVLTAGAGGPFTYSEFSVPQGDWFVPTAGTITSVEFYTHHLPFMKFSGFADPWPGIYPLYPVPDFIKIIGSHFNDLLPGIFATNAIINGGGGNDTMLGGNGNDTMNGATGNDLMIAGLGNDRFTGSGINTFVFGAFGHDVIADFAPGDKLAFLGIFTGLAEVRAAAHVVGGHVVIEATPAHTITIDTLHHVNQLTHANVLFHYHLPLDL